MGRISPSGRRPARRAAALWLAVGLALPGAGLAVTIDVAAPVVAAPAPETAAVDPAVEINVTVECEDNAVPFKWTRWADGAYAWKPGPVDAVVTVINRTPCVDVWFSAVYTPPAQAQMIAYFGSPTGAALGVCAAPEDEPGSGVSDLYVPCACAEENREYGTAVFYYRIIPREDARVSEISGSLDGTLSFSVTAVPHEH